MAMKRLIKQLFMPLCCVMGLSLSAGGIDKVRIIMEPLKERWRTAKSDEEKTRAAQALDAFAALSRTARQAEKSEQQAAALREQNARLHDERKEQTHTIARLERQVKDRQHSFADRQQEIAEKFRHYEQQQALLSEQLAQLQEENRQLRDAAEQVLRS